MIYITPLHEHPRIYTVQPNQNVWMQVSFDCNFGGVELPGLDEGYYLHVAIYVILLLLPQ